MCITFIATAFDETKFPLIESLLLQTEKDWHLIICNNGPNTALHTYIDNLEDPRILYWESGTNSGCYGVYNRIQSLSMVGTKFVCQTSIQDVYVANAVELIYQNLNSHFIYWDSYNHLFDYRGGYLQSAPYIGRMDWGNCAIETDLARSIPITSPCEYTADGIYIEAIMATNPTTTKIPYILTLHN